MTPICVQWLKGIVTLAVLVSPGLCRGDGWKRNIEYFEKVDLDCAQSSSNTNVIHSVQAWILPSGDIWKQGWDLPGEHVTIRDNGLVLTIDRLDDGDFGVYYCIVNTGVNGTNIIKFGINVDGPYYGPELMDEVKHDAIVGGIAAGCALVLLVILWLLCAYCTPERNQPVIIQLGTSSDLLNHKHSNENINMTQIGDNVYYNADEVKAEEVEEVTVDEDKRGTLASTSSGDYHSIDSIDRNKKLQNGDPGEIYDQYVKSVHM